MRQCSGMNLTWPKMRIENQSMCIFCCAKERKKDAAFEEGETKESEEGRPLFPSQQQRGNKTKK